MVKGHTKNPSQLVEFVPGSYFDRTSRPIYALAYLFGFLLVYEIGTILISSDLLTESLYSQQVRIVSFIWLQNLVGLLGFPPKFTAMLTPVLVIIILLALQITSRKPWKVNFKDFIPMSIECVLIALPLIALSWLIIRSANTYSEPVAICQVVVDSGPPQLLVDIVSGIGAGIYEELIFRLVLICLLMLLFQDVLKFSKTHAIIFSVLISAGLFSLHHHIFPLNGTFETGEVFTAGKFIFRTAAGIYFAAIFAVRGFGIAAGAHAFYDIIAAILNAMMTE